MPPEKISSIEGEHGPEKMFETAAAVGERLIELGWTKEQRGNFTSAIQAMANEMGKVNFELNVVEGKDGGETAEVTILGEGAGLGAEEISERIDKGALFMKVFTEAAPEFFADQNKVILRRKRNRMPEADTIQG